MGGAIRTHRDFNRVLARQPPTSINIPRFEINSDLEQQILPDSLIIPDLVRISKSNQQREKIIFPTSNEFPFLNELFDSIQTLQPTNAPQPPPASSKTMPPFLNYSIDNKLKDDIRPPKQIEQKNIFNFLDSKLPTHYESEDSDATVISRDVSKRNDPRCIESQYPSSFQPRRSILERNGRKFVMESKQRTERRYVQCVDEATQRIRYFEVVDCIPSRTVRPYKNRPRSFSSGDDMSPNLQSIHHSNLSTAPHDQSYIPAPSSFTVKQTLPSSQFAPHIPKSCDFGLPPCANKNLDLYKDNEEECAEEIDRILRSKETQVPSGFKRINPSFYTQRNSIAITDGLNADYKSLTRIDPSKQSANLNYQDQYWKQPTIKNYDESLINNQSFQHPSSADHSKIPMNVNQANQPLYSYPKELFTKI